MHRIGAACLIFLSCAALHAQNTGFGGIAIDATSSRPLKGVHIKLFTLNVNGGLMDSWGAVSGPDGHFSVTGMPPGTYLLFPERTGFVHMITLSGSMPVPSVTLKSGAPVTDYRLEMTPRAALVARVVDEYGDPVPNVTVEATPVTPGTPVAAAVNPRNRTVTNALGEARITVGPGSFYIKASPAVAATRPGETRVASQTEAAYGPTWYPAALSAASASPVELRAGADHAIEIRLVRQRSITITGTVSGIPPESTAYVVLYSGTGPERFNNSQSSTVGPDGTFAFAKLPPSFYRVTAFTTAAGRGRLQSQPVDVTPDGPEKVNAPLVLTAGVEVTGALQIAGDRSGAPMEKRTITLGSSTATTEPDGTFKIGGVFPGRYRVTVQPLPENGYLQSVELDGTASTAPDVDLVRVAQDSRLRITLARDGAQLSGRVLDKDGQPLGNTVAIVLLVPDRDHIMPNQDGMVKEGKYGLKGIRPGKYLLFAIDAFRSGPASSVEDLQKMAVAAEEIEIKAGDRIARDVKLLLKEDVDARTKK